MVHIDASLIRANVSWKSLPERHVENVQNENQAEEETAAEKNAGKAARIRRSARPVLMQRWLHTPGTDDWRPPTSPVKVPASKLTVRRDLRTTSALQATIQGRIGARRVVASLLRFIAAAVRQAWIFWLARPRRAALRAQARASFGPVLEAFGTANDGVGRAVYPHCSIARAGGGHGAKQGSQPRTTAFIDPPSIGSRAAALPTGVEHLGDGGLHDLVRVGDDQLDATQAAASELAQKRRPERLGFGGTISMPRTSRRPSLSTPTATITETETMRPFWRAFT